MNPIKNFFLRATGIAPLVGLMPLLEHQYKKLFEADLAFVNYFPVVGYEEGSGAFLMSNRLKR